MIENFDKDILFEYMLKNPKELNELMGLYKNYNLVNKYAKKTLQFEDEAAIKMENAFYEKLFENTKKREITEQDKILYNFQLLKYKSDIYNKETNAEIENIYALMTGHKRLSLEDINRIKKFLVIELSKLGMPITFYNEAYKLFEEKYNYILALHNLDNEETKTK